MDILNLDPCIDYFLKKGEVSSDGSVPIHLSFILQF